jgi:uncharacterized protein
MIRTSQKSRTYHDPIHGAVHLNAKDPIEFLLIQLVDSSEFQRLRRIRQLDVANLTFHGAEGSRFTHALGVLAVARRVFDRLIAENPELAVYRALVLCSALLHDLGHGPFSHASEEVFHFDHEQWTMRLLREDTHVHRLLCAFDAELPEQICQLLQKQAPLPLLGQLISGQLDCDRLDYLLRDSYFTGAQYGHLDLDRIIHALAYDQESGMLVVRGRKGLVAIEHYLVVRYFMYSQVYNHPKNLCARLVLASIFKRATVLHKQGVLEVDSVLAAWLGQDPSAWTLDDYLRSDDVVFSYHIQRWTRADDPLLADLCSRYLDRNLPKAWEVTHLKPEQRRGLLDRLQSKAKSQGYDPDSHFGLVTSQAKGYSLYDRGIFLQTDEGLVEIAEASSLVKSLILTNARVWLVYPRELHDEVKRLLELQRMMTGATT